jgi:hypothetical protein
MCITEGRDGPLAFPLALAAISNFSGAGPCTLRCAHSTATACHSNLQRTNDFQSGAYPVHADWSLCEKGVVVGPHARGKVMGIGFRFPVGSALVFYRAPLCLLAILQAHTLDRRCYVGRERLCQDRSEPKRRTLPRCRNKRHSFPWLYILILF